MEIQRQVRHYFDLTTCRVRGLALDIMRICGFSAATLLLSTGNAQTLSGAVASPDAVQAIDHGLLVADSGSTPISVTVALHLPALDEAEKLMTALHTPGDPQFHKFLTASEFVARFAPKGAEVASVISALGRYGLSAEKTTATTLKVTGLPADMERAFAVTLHSYEMPAHGNAPAYGFHAPLTPPTIPAEIAVSVSAIVGLDSSHSLRPHLKTPQQGLTHPAATADSTQGDALGLWTVTDFANYYDVVPLYKKGLSGKGRTIGIVTLASFTPSDAFAYWNSLGLNVDPNRLQMTNVDGGPGAPSDASGSGETALDVEQSGGVAPGAKMIVYQAPNTDQGFVDVFAAAIDANIAESISTSWGAWEWYYNLANGPVTDPATGRIAGRAQALHELFVRAAIQGQTLFAAAGDLGAYDPTQAYYDGSWNYCFPFIPPTCGIVTGFCFPANSPTCSITLGVDYPASDPAITAAGGTTVPGEQWFCANAACAPPYFYNSQITLDIYAHAMKDDEVRASELWDEATAEIIGRTQKSDLKKSAANADVIFRYPKPTKLVVNE